MSPSNGDEHPPKGAVGGSRVEPDVIFTNDEGDSSSTESTDQHWSDGVDMVDLDGVDSGWTPYFRYDTAYSDQVDAIETFVELLSDNGYYLLEGACGTGKTLAAVIAGIHSIRDRGDLTERYMDDAKFYPEYSRLLAVTPVKQQLKQFINEMRGINQSLPDSIDPVDTVVMRGRTDLMAFAYTDASPFDRVSVSEKADHIREMARRAIKFDSDIPLNWPDGVSPPDFSLYDYDWSDPSDRAERYKDRYRHDPYRAQAVQEIVANMIDDTDFDRLVVDGVETPYPDYVPHTNDIVDMAELKSQGSAQLPMDLQGKFDPFYVGFFANHGGLSFDFDEAPNYVFDKDALFESAAKRGVCPHEAMAALAKDAEVVLGNYNHLFDPQTRLLTNDKIGLLDDETIAVVDEAHQVERKVRDMLSAELDIYTLDKAIYDVEIVLNYVKGNLGDTPTPDITGTDAQEVRRLVSGVLDSAGRGAVDVDELVDTIQLLRFVKQKMIEYGAQKLSDEYDSGGWQEQLDRYGPNQLEKKLTEPGSGDTDDLMADSISRSFEIRHFKNMPKVMTGVKAVFDSLEAEGIYSRQIQGVEVGEFFERWATEDNIEYYRHLILDDSPKDSIPDSYPEWVQGWTPKIQLFNSIPRDELRAIFSDLGGGVLMSATIQPADVYKEAVGVDAIPYFDDPQDEAEKDNEEMGSTGMSVPSQHTDLESGEARPTEFDQFPLRFPTDNRLSLTVDLPKYTYSNRGKKTPQIQHMSETRLQYANAMKVALQQDGNVMVVLPNYGEAKWACEFMQKQSGVSKDLYLDQSSSSDETSETLESFFSGGDSAIFTSAWGTITEGVDYEGHKLHSCVVVGIPLMPTNTPRNEAVKVAYDERMNGSGFETALTIPAVRKVRQAFGRVIRGDDEFGVRMLFDNRYASDSWDGVKEYLSAQEQEEFQLTEPDRLNQRLANFWSDADYTVNQPDDTDSLPKGSAGESSQGGGVEVGSNIGVDVDRSQSESGESESVIGTVPVDELPDYDSDEVSQIYFGQEANLSSWVEINREAVVKEILPIVRAHSVDESQADAVDTIKLNFTKDLDMGGWIDVESEAVINKIEPIARRYSDDLN